MKLGAAGLYCFITIQNVLFKHFQPIFLLKTSTNFLLGRFLNASRHFGPREEFSLHNYFQAIGLTVRSYGHNQRLNYLLWGTFYILVVKYYQRI